MQSIDMKQNARHGAELLVKGIVAKDGQAAILIVHDMVQRDISEYRKSCPQLSWRSLYHVTPNADGTFDVLATHSLSAMPNAPDQGPSLKSVMKAGLAKTHKDLPVKDKGGGPNGLEPEVKTPPRPQQPKKPKPGDHAP